MSQKIYSLKPLYLKYALIVMQVSLSYHLLKNFYVYALLSKYQKIKNKQNWASHNLLISLKSRKICASTHEKHNLRLVRTTQNEKNGDSQQVLYLARSLWTVVIESKNFLDTIKLSIGKAIYQMFVRRCEGAQLRTVWFFHFCATKLTLWKNFFKFKNHFYHF